MNACSKVAVAESQHLAQLQAGLAKAPWLADCLAVPKGRSLVPFIIIDIVKNIPIFHHEGFAVTASPFATSRHCRLRGAPC